MRLLKSLIFGLAAIGIFTLVSIQFARIIGQNVAMARSLYTVEHDVVSLRQRKREQEMTVRRLLDPDGAIPEIHDRLHLVGPNEAIIYVKSRPSPKP